MVHMVLSDDSTVTITAYVCRRMLPDPEFYTEVPLSAYATSITTASEPPVKPKIMNNFSHVKRLAKCAAKHGRKSERLQIIPQGLNLRA